ncbi:MAG: DMT family transporter [Candidatus Anstonellales archaeon]
MKSYLLVVVSGIFLGIISFLKRILQNHFSDTFIATSRLFLASVFLLIILLATHRKKEIRITREEIVPLAIIGIAIALSFYFYFLSISRLPFFVAVTLIFTTPFFSVILESLMEKIHVGKKVIIGMALLFIGVGIFFYENTLEPLSDLLGIVFGLVGALCSAFANEQIKFEERRHSVFKITLWSLFFGFMFLAPLLHAEGIAATRVDLLSLYAIGIIGFLTAITFILFDYSLAYHEPHVSSAIHNSSAFLTSFLLSTLVLFENISLGKIAGALLIITANIIINRYSHTSHKLHRI